METTQDKDWEDLLVLTKKMPQTEILVVDQAKDPVSPPSCPQLMPQEIIWRVSAHNVSSPHIQGQRAQVFPK